MGSEWVQDCSEEERRFLGRHNLFFIGLGPDQQQHPTVHSGGGTTSEVAGGGSVARPQRMAYCVGEFLFIVRFFLRIVV